MAAPREIRRLAFQALYQLEAQGGDDPSGILETVRASLEDAEGYTPAEYDRAMALALAAYQDRHRADELMTELAPEWPANRQAAVDRAILRLAHYEMTRTTTHPKIAVNEAVELAKTFSTEKSPAFVNALLDKLLKRVAAPAATDQQHEQTEPTGTTTPGADAPITEHSRAEPENG